MRISRDAWAMGLAQITAQRSTCLRRQVGAVLLNGRGHVMSTGYNGPASGEPHCNDGHPCPGAQAASGTDLDGCYALHAEQNALLQCRDPWLIEAAYLTASPCITCVKLLMNTTCRRIVFAEDYPHPAAKSLWLGSWQTVERTWEKIGVNPF